MGQSTLRAVASRPLFSHAMFDDRHTKRTFYNAPQSVTSFVAALLEPLITVVVFLLANLLVGEPLDRPEIVLCMFVFVISLPGRNRFREGLLTAATDIGTSWITLLGILALCGYATHSFYLYDSRALMWWAVVTPVAQWLGVWTGKSIIRRQWANPAARRTAVIVGAGPVGM